MQYIVHKQLVYHDDLSIYLQTSTHFSHRFSWSVCWCKAYIACCASFTRATCFSFFIMLKPFGRSYRLLPRNLGAPDLINGGYFCSGPFVIARFYYNTKKSLFPPKFVLPSATARTCNLAQAHSIAAPFGITRSWGYSETEDLNLHQDRDTTGCLTKKIDQQRMWRGVEERKLRKREKTGKHTSLCSRGYWRDYRKTPETCQDPKWAELANHKEFLQEENVTALE